MADTKKDSRLARAGVSESTIVREGVKNYTKECPSCGTRHPFRSMPSAKRAEQMGTLCKICSSTKTIERYNGVVKEEHGIRTSWLKSFERGAKARALVFDINEAEVARLYKEQEGLCALSGIPITLPNSSKFSDITASIDRVDNTIGYTPSNIQLVHKKINMLRGSLSVEEFITLCKAVSEYN